MNNTKENVEETKKLKPKDKPHYVNNKQMWTAALERKQQLEKIPDDEHLPISKYLAECIIKICQGTCARDNFSGYVFVKEMELDAIENCIRVFDKYDPEKHKNIFGYFSRVAWNACLRKIKEEKKAYAIKLMSENEFIRLKQSETNISPAEKEYRTYVNEWIEKYEDSLQREKEKNQKKTAERLAK